MKKQSGFVTIVAVVVALLVVAGVGYAYYTAAQKGKTPATTTSTTDPYANWKTFTSTIDGLTFKYPSDWKMEDTSVTESGQRYETLALIGPNGLKLSYNNPLSGIGGACPDPCTVTTHTFSSEVVEVGAKGKVYLVRQHVYDPMNPNTYAEIMQVGLMQLGDYDSADYKSTFSLDKDYVGFPAFLTFTGKGKLGTDANHIMMQAYDRDPTDVTADWFKRTDVKTAELILKSARY